MIKLSKKTLAILIIVVLSPVLVPLLFLAGSALMAGIYWSFGYYVNMPGWKMGQIAAEKESVEECELLRKTWYFGGFDSGDMHRSECIHTYASLTLDPTACELLLPSDYGWSCLGAVEEKLFVGDPCYYSPVRDDVYCNKNYSEGELTIEHPQMDNCSLYQRNDLREWCHYERTLTSKDVHECDSITHPVVYDNCEYSHALKLKDLSFCSPIKDPSRRSFCEFRVKMAVKYSGKRFSAVQ